MSNELKPTQAIWNRAQLFGQCMPPQGQVLDDGTTPGKVALTIPGTAQDIGFTLLGYNLSLTPTAGVLDDLFDCSGFTDTGTGEYCKVLLSLTAAGAGVARMGDVAASQDLAVCPALPLDESVVGWLEVPDGVDWDDVGGLVAQSVVMYCGFAPLL